MTKVGNLEEDMKPYALMIIKKSKELAKQICHIHPQKRSVGISNMAEEENATGAEGPHEQREIHKKLELETISMKEISRRRRM